VGDMELLPLEEDEDETEEMEPLFCAVTTGERATDSSGDWVSGESWDEL